MTSDPGLEAEPLHENPPSSFDSEADAPVEIVWVFLNGQILFDRAVAFHADLMRKLELDPRELRRSGSTLDGGSFVHHTGDLERLLNEALAALAPGAGASAATPKQLSSRAVEGGVPFFLIGDELIYDAATQTHFDLAVAASGGSLEADDLGERMDQWYVTNRPRGGRFTIRNGGVRLLRLSRPIGHNTPGTELEELDVTPLRSGA